MPRPRHFSDATRAALIAAYAGEPARQDRFVQDLETLAATMSRSRPPAWRDERRKMEQLLNHCRRLDGLLSSLSAKARFAIACSRAFEPDDSGIDARPWPATTFRAAVKEFESTLAATLKSTSNAKYRNIPTEAPLTFHIVSQVKALYADAGGKVTNTEGNAYEQIIAIALRESGQNATDVHSLITRLKGYGL